MAAEPSAKFWDRMANRYARSSISDETTYQLKLIRTRERLKPDMNVLEFGCGTGSTALIHAPHVRHILATDVSARMIEIARKKLAQHGISNVDFQQSSINALERPPESFDAVLGLSVLHLVEDRDAVISKVFDLVKPGGMFVSSTACLADGMSIFKWIGPVGYRLGLLPILRVFSAEELVASIKAAGFEIEYEWHPGKNKAVFIIARKPG